MKSFPESEAFELRFGWETEASGLAVVLKKDGLLGIVASKDLFWKGKVVFTFCQGDVSGFLWKTGRTTLFWSMNFIPPNLKESWEYL